MNLFDHTLRRAIFTFSQRADRAIAELFWDPNTEQKPVSGDEQEKFRRQTVEKLKKKGWSEAKIERWFKEQALNEEKEERSRELQHETSITFASDWVEFIRDMLASKAAAKVGLLLHMYDGPLNGRFSIVGKERITLKSLNENILLQMAEDVIYDFVP